MDDPFATEPDDDAVAEFELGEDDESLEFAEAAEMKAEEIVEPLDPLAAELVVDETSGMETTPPTLAPAEPQADAVAVDDDDPEEVLPHAFLEPLGAAAVAATAPVATEPRLTSRRSRRRRNEDPDRPLSTRERKFRSQAKFIIYGGLTLMLLACAVLASWKVPLWINGKLIWPWTEWIKHEQVERFLLPNGKEISKPQGEEFQQRSRALLTEARKQFAAAQAKWEAEDKRAAWKLANETIARLDKLLGEMRPFGAYAPLGDCSQQLRILRTEIWEQRHAWSRLMPVTDMYDQKKPPPDTPGKERSPDTIKKYTAPAENLPW